MLIIFTLIIYFFNPTHAVQCKLSGTTCTFSDLTTTETDMYFQPSAENNTTVEKVEFENSKMPILTDELCKAFPNVNLRFYSLSMKTVTSGALFECKKLQVVFFYRNKLEKLDTDTFTGNPLLEKINLQGNSFTRIDERMFEPVWKLKSLILGENMILRFPVNNYPGLIQLEELYLFSNDLTDLDDQKLVQKFPNLKEIYLHNNLFDCDRLKTIIQTLHQRNIAIKEWEKHLMLRNTHLMTIEGVECVQSHIPDLIKEHTEKLEAEDKKLVEEYTKLNEKVFYLMIITVVVIGILALISVTFCVTKIVKKVKTNKIPRTDDYYYEDTSV